HLLLLNRWLLYLLLLNRRLLHTHLGGILLHTHPHGILLHTHPHGILLHTHPGGILLHAECVLHLLLCAGGVLTNRLLCVGGCGGSQRESRDENGHRNDADLLHDSLHERWNGDGICAAISPT
ncbi:MAG: hypothetical protein H0X65_01900, partial [Gemmatimonadetes bacterium]|nr:hypothetical protein [Gemmatimonadota bacterium]